MSYEHRVIGCFKGLVSGDAIGKQTETLSRPDVHRWYPEGITGFHGRPGDVIPRYLGKRYQWRIGETTDDTEQTIAVATAILRTRAVSHESIGTELLRCSKSVHPGVSMWSFIQRGDPARIAPDGDGCGAAMRCAPVGVIYPPGRFDDLIRGAYECAIPTHGGRLAICAAAAVACAVSAAIDGASPAQVLAAALSGSQESSLRASLEQVHADLAMRKGLVVDDIAERYFPDKTAIIVPLAISLALITESAEETAVLAANLGGDADSVASIGGAIAGAIRPESVNESWFDVVRSVNQQDILGMAASLAVMRSQG